MSKSIRCQWQAHYLLLAITSVPVLLALPPGPNSPPALALREKLMMTETITPRQRIVGPHFSWYTFLTSRCLRILSTRHMYNRKLYTRSRQAMTVNAQAVMMLILSCPKLRSVRAIPLTQIENSSHERNVRSTAKNTLGSTRTGTWIPAMMLEEIQVNRIVKNSLLLPLGALNLFTWMSSPRIRRLRPPPAPSGSSVGWGNGRR